MKFAGELRENGPVDSSWKMLARLPTKRVPGILAIPAVLPLLGTLLSTVIFEAIEVYVMSHTNGVSIGRKSIF